MPGLILETREDARRFLEAMKRKELRERYRAELDDSKTNLELDSSLHLLAEQRCKIAFAG